MAPHLTEERVPLLGFHRVLSLLAIFSAYVSPVLLFCCTSGLLGVLQVVFPRIRKSSGEREEDGKLSVLCSADLEDDHKSGHSRLATERETDLLLHGGHICFGDGIYDGRRNAQAIPLHNNDIKMKPLDENQKKYSPQGIGEDGVADGHVSFQINSLSKKLKDRHVSGDVIRNSYEPRKFPGKYFGTVEKQPVENLDMSFTTQPRNRGCHETYEVFSYSTCLGSPWMGSDVPSDGNGTQSEDKKCHGNQQQGHGGGTSPNQGGHKRQHISSGTGSSAGGDDDGEDDEEKRRVKILHCCQTSVAVVGPKPDDEKPAGTGEEATVSSTHNQQTGTNSSLGSATPRTYDESASGAMQENVVPCTEDPGISLHSHADQMAMAVESGGPRRAPSVLEDWHNILIRAFQCQRNFGSQGDPCTDAACVIVRELVIHCASCRLHVYGGCPECVQYCTLLLYHTQHCCSQRCTNQCAFIKAHIQVHGVPDVQNWSLQLDKVFFQPEALGSALSESAVQPVNRSGCHGIAARGPLPNDTSVTISSRSSEPKVLQRPNKQLMPWAVSKNKLSVTDDGHYDENHEWLAVLYIGGGRYGRCHQCRDKRTGFLFAIKKIRLPNFNSQELEIWQSLSGRHPNIVELYGAVQTDEYIILFMEFMKGGSVHEYLEEHSLTEPQALDIVQQVMSAVDFMHENKYLHRDIKGANILFDVDGRVKLADFGAAVKLTNAEFQPGCRPCGTEAFMAPEVCRSEDHSFSADVWMILCLLYQLLTGKPPWQQYAHCTTLLYIIGSAEEPPDLPPECSAAVADLFHRGFIIEPSERETIKQLLRHQVFAPDPVHPTESSGHALAEQIPPAEQLSSLQSDLLLETLQNEASGDFFLAAPRPTEAEFDQAELLADQLNFACAQGDGAQSSDASANPATALPETAAYSVGGLTKVHILKPDGELLFTVRHSPFTTYGALAGELHGSVADQTGLNFFTLTWPDGGRLEVCAAIGPEEQSLKVEPAYDVDNWQGWRVDQYGLVEQRPCG